ncbi:MAG: ATP synthase F1 subunit delta [Agathobacter sp.]|nr:ATP synthase F1 subunit delta [Agathobacter sp.]MEE1101269.1 ATP synthase F1 subunit delta [Agathobacter sp.]
MAKLVSKTYGDALFEVALENNQLDSMLEEVKAVSAAIVSNEDLTKLMNHPKIVKEEKIKVIEDIFTGKVSKELVGLMRMVVEKDHYNELNDVFLYFINQVKEYKNIGTAYVTSAIELNDSQKQAVLKRLLETTKYVEFEMHYDVDAALIGGMKIRIGDRVVDSSIQNKLYNLTRELSNMTI